MKHKNVRIRLSRFYVFNKGGNMMECLGCKLANEEEIIYKIYEDDYVTCFLDHEPFYPVTYFNCAKATCCRSRRIR